MLKNVTFKNKTMRNTTAKIFFSIAALLVVGGVWFYWYKNKDKWAKEKRQIKFVKT